MSKRDRERGYREDVWAGMPNYVAEDGYASVSEDRVREHVAMKRMRARAAAPKEEPEQEDQAPAETEPETPADTEPEQEPEEPALEETGE